MQTKSTNSSGTTFNVSNSPGTNGAPANAWENLGNLFLDSSGRRGTLYLNLSVDQLKALLAQAKASKDGKLSRKFSVYPRKPKAAAPAAQQPAASAA